MVSIVIDSNILFSAILNLNSNIGQILITGQKFYDFYAPKYARTELLKHKDKIKIMTGFTEDEFHEIYELVIKNITVLNHSILPEKDFQNALQLCQDIDIDDSLFVGFSNYLTCKLWTGDKKLAKGLKRKGFQRIIGTQELFEDFIKKSKRKE